MKASKQSIAAKKAWLTIRARYSKDTISSWHRKNKPKPTRQITVNLPGITKQELDTIVANVLDGSMTIKAIQLKLEKNV